MSFLSGLANLINPSRFSSVGQVSPAALSLPATTSNKSGKNPFIGPSSGDQDSYGKNKPVPGGYFAGYYNGKPNIVGSKLFIVI